MLILAGSASEEFSSTSTTCDDKLDSEYRAESDGCLTNKKGEVKTVLFEASCLMTKELQSAHI